VDSKDKAYVVKVVIRKLPASKFDPSGILVDHYAYPEAVYFRDIPSPLLAPSAYVRRTIARVSLARSSRPMIRI
jgi:hypothetical protein